MRNAFFVILILCSLIIMQSCAKILGIEAPEKISKVESLNYLMQHDIDTSNVLFLKQGYFDTLRSKSFKPEWELGLRPIQCKMFDAQGKLIFQYSSCEGSLKNTKIGQQFPPENITNIDQTYSLENEKEMIQNFSSYEKNQGYTMFIYWATYTGSPGRNLLEKVAEHMESSGEDVAIYKLNIDWID